MSYLFKKYEPHLFDDLIKLCITALNDNKNKAKENMEVDDWENKSHTVLHALIKQKRFDLFHILYDNSEPIACGGCYPSDFDKSFLMSCVRCYLHPEYRNQHLIRKYFMPADKGFAIQNNMNAIGLSFNIYNKGMMKIWERVRFGENRPYRDNLAFGSSNFNIIDFPIMIKNTPQYLCYESLNPEWSFNFESIRANNETL